MINSTANVNQYTPAAPAAPRLLGDIEILSTPMSAWTDQQLVTACLRGDEAAWSALIRRYQNVMYFFARRYRASSADAADVFQLVCAELFVSLPRLRNQQNLRSWIMTVSAHQAYHWKRGFIKRARREAGDIEAAFDTLSTPPSSELELRQRDEAMRSAIDAAAAAVPGARPAALLRGSAAAVRGRGAASRTRHWLDRADSLAVPEEAAAHSRRYGSRR